VFDICAWEDIGDGGKVSVEGEYYVGFGDVVVCDGGGSDRRVIYY
jgi:hypothetical protein